jgi:hypothetical protein
MSMRAVRDGEALEQDEARELWAHFSAWMDEHPGDLAGFASALGVTSVRPALDAKGAVLVVSTTEAQTAYGHAARLGGPAAKAAKREKGAAPPGAVTPKSKGNPGSKPSKPKPPKQPR